MGSNGEKNDTPEVSIVWERDGYDMVGTEARFGEYEFRAVICPDRSREICDELIGFAEVTASCWLRRERATLNIAHLIVFPHQGIAPTPPCEHCSGAGSYVDPLPGDEPDDCPCPWCGGTGRDIVGQAQRFVEVLWESARKQVLQRIGGES